MTTVFWNREGVLMVKFMQQDHNNVRRVLRNTKKMRRAGNSKKKVWNADIRYSAPA
jgi:hypothetical protein